MKEINLTHNLEQNQAFLEEVKEKSGQNINRCYQCMKCTGGCPFQFSMDYPPSQIIRMLQSGMVDEVLNSFTIHTCATCSTCTTRCPRDIDISKVMDTLRVLAHRKGIIGKGKNMHVFHKAFMKSIENHGRLYEVGLAIGLNLGTGKVLQDTDLGFPMFLKGKLSILPHNIKGKNEIKRLFDYAKKIGE